MTSSADLIRRLAATPALSAERERTLALATRAGDEAARQELIEASWRCVAQRVRLLGFRGDAAADALQAGTLGLIAAIDRFDPDRGARLSTFAWWWIGDAMRAAVPPAAEHLTDEVPDVAAECAPASLLDGIDLPSILRERFRVGEESGRPRSRAEVAQRLNCTVAQVREQERRALCEVRQRLAMLGHRAPDGADPL